MKQSSKVPHTGSTLTLPILKTISVKGRDQYVVLYEDRQLRVPKLETDSPGMKEVRCRIASVNLFNVPTLERIDVAESAQSSVDNKSDKETTIIEKVVSVSSESLSFLGKVTKSFLSDRKDEVKRSSLPEPTRDVYVVSDKSKTVDRTQETKEAIHYVDSSVVIPRPARSKDDVQTIDRSSKTYNATSVSKEFYPSAKITTILSGNFSLGKYLFCGNTSDFKQWFVATGGLKTRLDILYLIARQELELHRKNYFCGLSQEKDIEINVVDGKVSIKIPSVSNMLSGFSSIPKSSEYLPPEVNLGRMPLTPLSDCYTFAIIVHQLLCFCNPFEGDIVLKGDENLRRESWQGKLPWIENISDPRNRRTQKFFDGFFVTDSILALFKRTFEQGLHDPLVRPTMHEWCDVLERAYDGLTFCSKCKTHYLYDKEGCCTLCDEEPECISTIEVRRWFCAPKWNEEDQLLEDKFCLEPTIVSKRYLQNNGKKIQVWTNHLMIPVSKNQILFELELSDSSIHQKKIIIYPHNNNQIYVMSGTGQVYQKPITSVQAFIVNDLSQKQFIVAVKPFDVEQRVVIIK